MKTLKALGFVAIFSFVLAACTPDPELQRVYSGVSKVYSGATHEVYKFIPAQRSITHVHVLTLTNVEGLSNMSETRRNNTFRSLFEEALEISSAQCAKDGKRLAGIGEPDSRGASIYFGVACQ